ncbi:MAG: sigma-70 family RNA polymerase sigma factor [Polyangiaceae bacterium]|nr:sigma-70 family RNA polymerase sigma factor [Myxococcales bacterium]
MSSERDRADIFAVAEGDREALGRLYDRHAPVLLALAQRILKNQRESEDLLHDVFVEAWRRAGDYDPQRGSVATWLRLRMRSRALDRVRSARLARQESFEGGTAVDFTAEASQSPEEAANGAFLQSALDALPVDQRDVVVLGYFEGLSSSEIAARVGVPLGTVKSRAAAAMAKLRASLLPGGAA